MSVVSIPVEFEYEGIWFEGVFYTQAGDRKHWSLLLYNYNYGSLIEYYAGWRWCPNEKKMFTEPYMLEFFLGVIHGSSVK
jgi:hypothetical protein